MSSTGKKQFATAELTSSTAYPLRYWKNRSRNVQLEQVVLNLLINAMDATGEVSAGDRTILVRSEADGKRAIHVAVQDAGVGLHDGNQERIFQPFFTTKPAGMGMGLSVAKSIIEAHGGAIWATANPARGATFHFSLPEAPKEPAAQK